MRLAWSLLVILAFPAVGWAQAAPAAETAPPYQPAVPAPSTTVYGGGGWGYSTPGTPAGAAMNGMANVISAKGDYNLSTSAAAINMTQAQKNEIQNRQLWTNTYFEMRATNKAAREAEAGPKPTAEQLARIAHDGVPKKLGPSQINPATGKLDWPGPLQDASFAGPRGTVDQLFTKFATYGGLTYSEQSAIRQAVDGMYAALKAQIKQIAPPDYVACRNFLSSVLYAVTKGQLQ